MGVDVLRFTAATVKSKACKPIGDIPARQLRCIQLGQNRDRVPVLTASIARTRHQLTGLLQSAQWLRFEAGPPTPPRMAEFLRLLKLIVI